MAIAAPSMRCKHEYDKDRLLTDTAIDPFSVLVSLGIPDATSATRITGGWDATIWKVECGEETFALRLFGPAQARSAIREADTMRAVSAAGLTVPQIHAEGEWQDRRAMLLSWCPGRTLMQEMRRRPWAIRRLGFTFGQQQANLNQTRFTRDGAPETAWITWFSEIDNALHERLLALDLKHYRLLHLDYHPLNVMVVRSTISGVLDWTNAMPGDPRADVARTWTILRLMPLNPGRPEPVTEGARRLLAAGWLRGYEKTAGRLQDMDLFKAWGATAMLADLAAKLGQPGVWLEQHDLDAIETRMLGLRHRAGLSGR